MNKISSNTLDNLLHYFPTNKLNLLSLENHWQAQCSIGIEVEVKWRDYFPKLYEKYLKNISYDYLSNKDKIALTNECNLLEQSLLPKLKITENCGIEKGQDKYYEFAFTPVTNIYLVYDQISLLENENLIPKGQHSIHFTIGGLTNTIDTYYLLFLLEMIMSSKERINSGFHKVNPKISSTWAKKGMGGIFLKEGRELKHNYSKAIELRTLLLNNTIDKFNVKYLKIISYLSDIIYTKQQNKLHKHSNLWEQFLKESKILLSHYNLTDKNWKKPNINKNIWLNYIYNFESIKKDMLPIIQALCFELNIKD